MDYRSLGRTGMQVSPLCLGAMMFGAWGEPDHDVSIKIIHRALDAGINFIDTADVYSLGESEEIVGKALAGGRRDDVIVATKFHGPMDVGAGQQSGDPNKRGTRAAGSSVKSRTACAGCKPTGLIFTRSIALSPGPTSRRPWPRLLTCSGKARSGRSARRPSRHTRSLRRSGLPSAADSVASSLSSRRIRSWCEVSKPMCCPWPRNTEWASFPGARLRAAG